MHARRIWIVLAVAALLTASSARAQDADLQAEQSNRRISRSPANRTAEGTSSTPRSTTGSWALGGPFLLLLVFGAVAVAYWKKQGAARIPLLTRDMVDVLGRKSLDPRTTLWMVRVGSKVVMLGATPAGLSTLTEVTDPLEVDLLAGLGRRSNPMSESTIPEAISGYSVTEPVRRTREHSPAAEQFARKLQRSVAAGTSREDSRAA